MEIRLLGQIRVNSDSNTRIGAAKVRWLLAFLALNVGRSCSVASIVDALWGERSPSTAPNLVQGYVSDLRKIVGPEAIQTSEAGYMLSIPEDAVDVVRFGDLLLRARSSANEHPEHALSLLDTALSLSIGGPFGETPPDGALAAAAVRVDEQRVDASELYARLMLDVGREIEAVPLLEELTRLHPYREGLWSALAQALYRTGRQADALRRLAHARRILLDELGVSPGPALIDIERQILDHDPALSGPIGVETHSPISLSMVGRRNELARLQNRLDTATSGSQHTVFVGGEPGIGKTTLAREASQRAADDATVVLTGRCDEHVAVPYRPFVEALADYFRDLGGDATIELLESRWSLATEVVPALKTLGLSEQGLGARENVSSEITLLERFDTLCWMLHCVQGDKRLFLVLEDLHWADSATLRLLHYLIAGHRLPRSLTVVTYRTTEPSELLADILADLRTEPQVERLSLAGLEPSDLLLLMHGQSAERDPEVAAWIYRETDGNPFLAVEIIDHIAQTGNRAGVPAGVIEVVSRRLRNLSPDTQLLLGYAAVLGETAPLSLLRQFASVVSDVPAALAESIRAGIVIEEDTDERRYRFTHAIIRKAASAMLSVLHLEDLHAAAAEAWASFPPSDDVTMAMASHYLAAGAAAQADDAVEAFIRAAAASDRTGAKVEAVQWYDHAFDRLSEDDERRSEIRLKKFVAAQVAWHWLHGDYGKRDMS